MTNKKLRCLAAIFGIVLPILACGLPSTVQPTATPTLDEGRLQTAVALTLQAQFTPQEGPSPTVLLSPAVLASLTATLTPTTAFTDTPSITTISVSVNTNCRTGPGGVYDLVGALLVGETTEVVASNPAGDYWYVKNPDRPGEFCWLWGEYATVVGNTSALAVYTPPPTPTPVPDFTVQYVYMEGCVGWDPGFKVTNTGGVTFKSAYIKVVDTDTAFATEDSTNVFDKRNGCAIAISIPTLPPGSEGWVYGNTIVYDPTGNKLEVTIKLCTEINLGGTCVTKTIVVKP